IDNLSDYYDVGLKKARLARFSGNPSYRHEPVDLADRAAVETVFARHKPQRVVNLAAQAGVRYAAENPHIYVSTNVTGFLHVIEGCRHHGVEHLVYASTSSVYGADTAMPFSEHQPTEHPLTLYAASKKANEMMAHSYAHLYGLPCTGLRFFTVYGPWGRPDMALFLFTRAILAGEPIKVFNHGHHKRSFTYIDDIAEGVVRALGKVPGKDDSWDGNAPDPASSGVAPYRIYNIGNEQPVAAALHRGAGTVPRTQGQDGNAAAAGRRRARYRGRHVGAGRRRGLQPQRAGGAGRGELRALVSGLLPGAGLAGPQSVSPRRQSVQFVAAGAPCRRSRYNHWLTPCGCSQPIQMPRATMAINTSDSPMRRVSAQTVRLSSSLSVIMKYSAWPRLKITTSKTTTSAIL